MSARVLAALALLWISAAAAADTAFDTCRRELALDAAACRQVARLLLPDTLPAARGNRHADDERAAQLGYRIFYNATFSKPSGMACATCHAPEKGFNDRLPVSRGHSGQALTRNAPTLLNAAWLRAWFWDGRADTLWSQPLFALENPQEMNFSRLELAAKVASLYGSQYRAVFGELPPLADTQRFPFAGEPGSSAWQAMQPDDRAAIDRVAANVGKALEAFLRKLAARRAPFDEFLLGRRVQLPDAARRGVREFVAAGCMDCHSGPLLSDERFHGVALMPPSAANDRARAAGIEQLLANPFNAAGAFYDDDAVRPALPARATAADEGAWRTPSLRNLALSAPYSHDGRFATLPAVIRAHAPARVSDAQVQDIAAFLQTLSGQLPPLPWANWPGA